ncbi:uncharacterized protein MP3633_0147 [Marinomonas primoryensis]|uniref:Uncharacterized protein n=1 Tax=Marinomonas primoryensis TaxID=178399 RepID=A0A859CRW5_9GAMM|nr:uncharacterized protein MP3633_0147 [Marinomonas primoryensis]
MLNHDFPDSLNSLHYIGFDVRNVDRIHGFLAQWKVLLTKRVL